MLDFIKKLFNGGSNTSVKSAPKKSMTDADMDSFMAKTAFTSQEVNDAINLALADEHQGMEFTYVTAIMAMKGTSPELAKRVINMLPIMCGRKMMQELSFEPAMADYYILNSANDFRTEVKFADCGVCQIINQKIDQEPQLAMMMGMGSCEMLAFNDAMSSLGDNPTEEQLRTIRILPTEMGGDPLTVTP